MKQGCRALAALAALLLCVGAVSADELADVEGLLNHANTYYWLARARGSAPYEFRKSAAYAEKALQTLKRVPRTRKNAGRIAALERRAKAHLKALKAQLAIAKDALSNAVPLYNFVLGLDDSYDHADDPREVAAENAMAALKQGFTSAPGASQTYALVLSSPRSPDLEELVHEFLNENSSAYAVSPHEIAATLTPEDVAALYADPTARGPLAKIAKAYDTPAVTVYVIARNDEVDDVYYYGATLKKVADGKGVVKIQYMDGFCEDTRPKVWVARGLGAIVFALTIVMTFVYAGVNRDRTGRAAPFWVGGAACLAGVVIIRLAFAGLAQASPNPLQYYYKTTSVVWLLTAAAVLTLAPLVICYLVFSRIGTLKDRFLNPDTQAALAFGALAAAPVVMASSAAVRFDLASTLAPTAAWVVSLMLVAFRFGRAYSRSAIRRERSGTSEALILLAVAYLLGLASLFWTNASPWVFPIIAVVGALIAWGGPGSVCRVVERVKALYRGESEDASEGLEWLAAQTSEPSVYIPPQEGLIEDAARFVTENHDPLLQVIFVEAPQGTGKSRAGAEIAREIERQNAERGARTVILRGDCDEFADEGAAVPYEPFAQAMGDFLGVGRFDDPAEKAEKVRKGLTRLGLGVALGSVGLSAIGSLLDTDASAQGDKTATANEMAYVVKQGLHNLSQGAQVVLVLEDIHWMDPVTFEMFAKLCELLMQDFERNEVCMILTARPARRRGENRAVRLIRDLGERQRVNLYDGVNAMTLEHKDLADALLDALRFEYDSRQRLAAYLRDSGISRPLHVLQTVKTLLENGQVRFVGGKFVVERKADLSRLPQPDDFVRMVQGQLEGLDPRVARVLECAAIVGREFRAHILADILNIERLELLDLLRQAEKSNLVEDVRETPDLFRFVTKNTVAVLRSLSNVSRRQEDRLAEIVKEYHYRFVACRERELTKDDATLTDAALADLTGLATRAFLIRDVIPGRALAINRAAAELSYDRGRILDARNYFENAVRIIEEGAQLPDEEMLAILLAYSRCVLDTGGDLESVRRNVALAREIIERSPDAFPEAEAELRLLGCCEKYDSGDVEAAVGLAEEVLDDPSANRAQRLRARYRIACAMPAEDPTQAQEARAAFEDLIREIDEEVASPGGEVYTESLLKTQSDALDRLGMLLIEQFDAPEEAMERFRESIKLNDRTARNDRRGVATSHAGIAECWVKRDDHDKARREFQLSLQYFEITGVTPEVIRVSRRLGWLELDMGAFEDADKRFNMSCSFAKNSGDLRGRLLAVAGILETALASGDESDLRDGAAKARECIGETDDDARPPHAEALRQVTAPLERAVREGRLREEDVAGVVEQ